MHDFLLAKQIVDEVLKVIKEKKIKKVKSVILEVGDVSLAHDEFAKHAEEIDLKNLEFGILNLTKNTILKKTKFKINKTSGNNWRIVDIEIKR